MNVLLKGSCPSATAIVSRYVRRFQRWHLAQSRPRFTYSACSPMTLGNCMATKPTPLFWFEHWKAHCVSTNENPLWNYILTREYSKWRGGRLCKDEDIENRAVLRQILGILAHNLKWFRSLNFQRLCKWAWIDEDHENAGVFSRLWRSVFDKQTTGNPYSMCV